MTLPEGSTYEPVPTDELEALVAHDGSGLPREAVTASQRFLAQKLLEAQAALVDIAALRQRLEDRRVMARGVLDAEGLGHVAALVPIEEVMIWMDELSS